MVIVPDSSSRGSSGMAAGGTPLAALQSLQDVLLAKGAELSEIKWGSGEEMDSARIGWRLVHGGGRSILRLPLRNLLL
jgi:hypothetical protein